jgi:hypothetical protein
MHITKSYPTIKSFSLAIVNGTGLMKAFKDF